MKLKWMKEKGLARIVPAKPNWSSSGMDNEQKDS
jgi:hypothetical protein